MEITPEMQELIEKKAAEIAEEKAKEIAETKAAEIVKQVADENAKKVEQLNATHAAEIKTYKDSIAAIINGKNEPEKSKMQLLVDEINARRRANLKVRWLWKKVQLRLPQK